MSSPEVRMALADTIKADLVRSAKIIKDANMRAD